VVLPNEGALILPLTATPAAELRQSAQTPIASMVAAARDGDRTAFADLYQLHVRMVHGILLARVPCADVDDLVQEVFLTVMRRLSTLRDPLAFPGWLAAIARNEATDHLRRRGADTVELREDLAVAREGDERAHVVLDALRSLPDAYRETMVLRLVEGMTGPEIAERTGLTEGSVRVNLHRGMRLLRARLEGRAER